MNHIVAIQKSITAQAKRATRLPSPVAQFRTFLRLSDKVAGAPAEVPPPAPPAPPEEGDKPTGEDTPPAPPEKEGAQDAPAEATNETTTEEQPNGAAPEVPPPAEGEGDTQGASEVGDEGQGSAPADDAEGKQDAPAKTTRNRRRK